MADRRLYTLEEGRTLPGAPLAFVEAAIQYQGHDCLLFPFAKDADGYGVLKHNGRFRKPHQLVCEVAHGPKPSIKHEVAHNCRQALCCNPAHLRWDTRKGNVLDCVGEARKFAKLTREDVFAIRTSRRSQRDLARQFGVSKGTIWDILHRRKWSWLPMTTLAATLTLAACSTPYTDLIKDAKARCQQGNQSACNSLPNLIAADAQYQQVQADRAAAALTALSIGLNAAAQATRPVYVEPVVVCRWNCW